MYVAEHGTASTVLRGDGYGALDSWTPNIGHRICALDTSSSLSEPHRVASVGAPTPGERPGQLNWPHSVAVDEEFGRLYVAEVSFCECGKFQEPFPREMVSLKAWQRTTAEGTEPDRDRHTH